MTDDIRTITLEQIEALRAFAEWVIREGWEGDVDACAVQDRAHALGLTRQDVIQLGEEIGDGEPGDECYRLQPWVMELGEAARDG